MDYVPVEGRMAGESQRVRTVAVHVTGDPTPFVGAGADRYWVGERGSCGRFLELAGNGTLLKWLEIAAASRRKVGLATPLLVDQADLEHVVQAINSLAGKFVRVMTGDLGVAAALRGTGRVYWCGRVYNVDHVIFLRNLGIDGIRAICPVSTGAMDVNREFDLEMPVFGRIPLVFGPDCTLSGGTGGPGGNGGPGVGGSGGTGGPGGNGRIDGLLDAGVTLTGRGGSLIVRHGYLESSEFLDLSDSLRPFGRDTVGVVETSGLTPNEVAEAVDAIRFGRAVDSTRQLFVSEQGLSQLP